MAEKIPVNTVEEMLDLLDEGVASPDDWTEFVDAIFGQSGKWPGFIYKNIQTGEAEQKPSTPPEPVRTVTALIPQGFFDMKPGYQYLFLTRQARLSQNDANDLLSHLAGNTVSTRYVIDEVDPSTVQDWTAKVVLGPAQSIIRSKVTQSSYKVVALSPTFRSLSSAQKVEFLTKNRRLLPIEANDVVDIVDGKAPRGGSKIEIEWEE